MTDLVYWGLKDCLVVFGSFGCEGLLGAGTTGRSGLITGTVSIGPGTVSWEAEVADTVRACWVAYGT